MPRAMPRSTTAAALVAIALALGGCGDDEVFRTSRPVLNITLDEYRIVPQNIEVRPGRLKLVVHNAGRLTHNLAIQVPVERVATMQPGQTAAPVKVTLAPGEYRIVCTIANHDDLGQYGTLKVR
jgi:uncharacterized cupredoxin-like copper-binding protein